MKIELRKETTWEKVYYWTYVDGIMDHVYFDPKEAEARYNALLENAKKPPVVETIKVVEV